MNDGNLNHGNDVQSDKQQEKNLEETEDTMINYSSENILRGIIIENLFEYNELYTNAKYGNTKRAKDFYK